MYNEEIEKIRQEEMPSDYYPPKDLANIIWGTCFQYKDIEKDGIKNKIKNACFMIEKLNKIHLLVSK
jgi:hypothetical protein